MSDVPDEKTARLAGRLANQLCLFIDTGDVAGVARFQSTVADPTFRRAISDVLEFTAVADIRKQSNDDGGQEWAKATEHQRAVENSSGDEQMIALVEQARHVVEVKRASCPNVTVRHGVWNFGMRGQ